MANSPSPPRDSGPSLRPATTYHPIAATPLRPQLGPQRSDSSRCEAPAHCAARHAAGPAPPPPPPPTTPRSCRCCCLPYTDCARPAPPQAGVGPRKPSAAGAASQAPDAGITWIPAFGLTPPVDLQAPQIWKRFFKSGRRRRPQNLLQFKLTAFLVSPPGSVSRAFECIDGGGQALGVPRE